MVIQDARMDGAFSRVSAMAFTLSYLSRDIEFEHFRIVVYFDSMSRTPNQSPEPTAVGACRSAVAVYVTSRRWLSFFR